MTSKIQIKFFRPKILFLGDFFISPSQTINDYFALICFFNSNPLQRKKAKKYVGYPKNDIKNRKSMTALHLTKHFVNMKLECENELREWTRTVFKYFYEEGLYTLPLNSEIPERKQNSILQEPESFNEINVQFTFHKYSSR